MFAKESAKFTEGILTTDPNTHYFDKTNIILDQTPKINQEKLSSCNGIMVQSDISIKEYSS